MQKGARVDLVARDATGHEVFRLMIRPSVLGVLGAIASIMGGIIYLWSQWKH